MKKLTSYKQYCTVDILRHQHDFPGYLKQKKKKKSEFFHIWFLHHEVFKVAYLSEFLL
jgi:hypothetical protein